MCFNFQNMAVLCDNNAEQSKFRFSRSPCGDARYLVIPCNLVNNGCRQSVHASRSVP